MVTLYVGLAGLLALIVAAIFVPILWIVVAIVLVLGVVYAWSLARGASRRLERRQRRRGGPKAGDGIVVDGPVARDPLAVGRLEQALDVGEGVGGDGRQPDCDLGGAGDHPLPDGRF